MVIIPAREWNKRYEVNCHLQLIWIKGGVEKNIVELAKIRLILGQFYFTLLNSTLLTDWNIKMNEMNIMCQSNKGVDLTIR